MVVVLRWKPSFICRIQNDGATPVPGVDSIPNPTALRRAMNSLFGITVLLLCYRLLCRLNCRLGTGGFDAYTVRRYEIPLLRRNNATSNFPFWLLIGRLFR